MNLNLQENPPPLASKTLENAEAKNATEEASPEKETITYTRTKSKKGRCMDTSSLPCYEVLHDLDNKTCGDCGHHLHKVRNEKTEHQPFIQKPLQLYYIFKLFN